MTVELAFVLAPRQNLFFNELVEALCDELRAAGARASIHVDGNFPPPREDLVYVLVPPHEYFTLMHGRRGPTPETLARTIFICAEQPDTSFFDENIELAPRAGAVFDINSEAIRAYRAHGITADHLQIGWTRGWDHFSDGRKERDIDVLFMGCLSERRCHALSEYAATLSERHSMLILSDNSRPNWRPAQNFAQDATKWELLRRARVLLNIHQGESPYFEWLRAVQAAASGAVLVTEASADTAPLIAGQHFVSGQVASLGLLCERVLSDPSYEQQIRQRAYAAVREDIPLAGSVRNLLAAAQRLATSAPVPDPTDAFFHQPPHDPAKLDLFAEPDRPPNPSGSDHNAAAVRRAVKALKIDVLGIRRDLARRQLTPGRRRVELIHRTRGYAACRPRVSVLMALYNYANHVTAALDSLARARGVAWEVVIVDDGSTDESCATALRWLRDHEGVAGQLLAHPVNEGLGPTRNDALDFARGEFCFVLDADNEVYPRGIARLVETLDADPVAAFSYGIHERFRGAESVGLANELPWEPQRLRVTNYIDAMALVRTEVLRGHGGYTTDVRLHGWEDYSLWCDIAEEDRRAAFVPEIVARYRTVSHSMLSLTNISSADAYGVLIDRHPKLMAGVQPPD